MFWQVFSRENRGFGKNLALLLGGQCIAIVGSGIFDIVLIWYALDSTKSYTSVSLLVFLRYIPYALFGLVCGWLSDRLNRKKLIVASDLFRSIIFFGAATALMAGSKPLIVLALISFLLTTARTLFQPALQGILPQLAQGSELVRANALLHGAKEMVGVAAPVLGGFLLVIFPAPLILIMIAVCFAFGGIMAAAIHVQPVVQRKPILLGQFIAEYRQLWRILLNSRRDVLAAMLVNVVAILGVAGILSLLIPIFIKEYLELGPTALGVFGAVMALGTVLGAIISVHISSSQRERKMLFAWLAYGLLIGVLVLPTQFAMILVIGFAMGIAGAVADVLFATIVQERMRGEHISKTFAGFSTLANCGEAISAPVLGLVATTFDLRAGFALGSLLPVVFALASLVYWSKRF